MFRGDPSPWNSDPAARPHRQRTGSAGCGPRRRCCASPATEAFARAPAATACATPSLGMGGRACASRSSAGLPPPADFPKYVRFDRPRAVRRVESDIDPARTSSWSADKSGSTGEPCPESYFWRRCAGCAATWRPALRGDHRSRHAPVGEASAARLSRHVPQPPDIGGATRRCPISGLLRGAGGADIAAILRSALLMLVLRAGRGGPRTTPV